VLDRLTAKLRRSYWLLLIPLILAALFELALVVWLDRDASVGREVWVNGVRVEAEVTAMVDRLLSPAELEVRFDWQGTEQIATIPPVWAPPLQWQTWDSSMVGRTVTIIFDPDHAAQVRLLEQGRVSPFVVPLTILGFVVAGAIGTGWARVRDARAAIRSASWIPVLVETQFSRFRPVPVLRPIGNTTVLVRMRRPQLGQGSGWAVRHKDTAVVVHGPTETAITARLRWRHSRDRQYLTPAASLPEPG
jgi:hypothetical protein